MTGDARQLRLLARIERRYRTVTRQIQVGELQIYFTRIADPDRILDEVAEAEDRREKLTGQRHTEPLHLPYWAELWESAQGIAQHLEEIRGTGALHVSSVLDLGCGMGLAGTVAAAMGGHILFADLEAPALLFARLNSLPWRTQVRARRLDWRKDRLDERFDLILGADILYERSQWDHLEPFWRAHLNPAGSVLLGEPGRQSGEMFIPWIKERGWALHEFYQKVPTREKPIRIIELRLA